MKQFFLTMFICCISNHNSAQESIHIFEKLKKAYPTFIKDLKGNQLVLFDNSSLDFDDGKIKSQTEFFRNPDIEDMFLLQYVSFNSKQKTDAGRIRNEAFFKKMYGNSEDEVKKKLVNVTWCPKLVNQKIMVTTINGVDKKIIDLSNELDRHPDLKKYLLNIGGTFNWRTIAGTNRLSMHSFGMTIDINIMYSDYWQWSCNCSDESKKLKYRNQIPKKLVDIFEKYGFIWGGNWTHFDTMHFEYRPELLLVNH